YKVWGWKQAIDEYGVYGMKSDNGLNCRSLDLNLPLGFGWYDDNGDLQGTYPFFATRELAKRYYWLFHVYRKEKYGRAGVIKLHAGAAWYPFVAAFVDYRAHGEGANFMSAHFAENLTAPEDFVLGRQHHRFGIPVYLLTKRMGMPFSPNYLYLYAHLFHMDLRAYPDQLRPSGWHWNEKDPYAGHRGGPIGEFAPYHTGRPGVHSTPCPQGISWMLKDDFGCQQAEFLGFWRNQDYVQVGATRAAASLWLHPGQAALFVVSNFHSAPDAIALRLNLARLGLAGQTLRAYDAWTDEDYPLTNDAVHLTIPGGQYRFVRLEPEH
ncbi:MAG: DUF6067 family protein, partial [Candidatus Marinimicrobia bacterium]|nr:DUF6067 family protein [Candidatus Neomarinimicrobiota bacterium]